ncbi:hypothetical protein K4F52_006416 [Lecanicillium sp. MT-2017a]|nr:hypothetical protein K4F52_006416 [Lecanicillium sp. MT-2017a]
MKFTVAASFLLAAVVSADHIAEGPNRYNCNYQRDDCCVGPEDDLCSVRGECPCVGGYQGGSVGSFCTIWASDVYAEGCEFRVVSG